MATYCKTAKIKVNIFISQVEEEDRNQGVKEGKGKKEKETSEIRKPNLRIITAWTGRHLAFII